MSEEVIEVQERKLSVTFDRKISDSNYGSSEVRVWVEDSVSATSTDAKVSERAVELINVAKAAAYDALGIEATVDESGNLREKFTPTAQLTRDAIERNMPGTSSVSNGSYETGGLEVAGDLKENVPSKVLEYCQQHGITKIWANEGKYGPYYREFVSQGESPKGETQLYKGNESPIIIPTK